MWDPYIAATKAHVPQAEQKIVFDRYHLMKYMNEAVDQVRKEEHRILLAQGNRILVGTKHLWLYAEENLPEGFAKWLAAGASEFATSMAYPFLTWSIPVVLLSWPVSPSIAAAAAGSPPVSRSPERVLLPFLVGRTPRPAPPSNGC